MSASSLSKRANPVNQEMCGARKNFLEFCFSEKGFWQNIANDTISEEHTRRGVHGSMGRRHEDPRARGWFRRLAQGARHGHLARAVERRDDRHPLRLVFRVGDGHGEPRQLAAGAPHAPRRAGRAPCARDGGGTRQGRRAVRAARAGNPPREILRFAEEHDAPIVIGGRGLSRVEGFFLGSVSQEIMEKAKGTVLIVK